MHFFLKLILLGAVLFNLGCSTIKTWTEKNVEQSKTHKEFSIQGLWVRRTTNSETEGFRKINRMSPIISDSVVVQGNAIDGIGGYDINSGRTVWKVNLNEGVEAAGVSFKNRVYIATSDGSVLALDSKTGNIYWKINTKSENLAQPFYDSTSGTLFVLAGNNVVHALDANSGKTIWVYSRQDTSSFSIRGGAQPILKDGLLYVGFSEGSFVALNAKSGTVAWEISLNKNKRFRDIDATAVLDKDRIYVSGFDDKLYALSLKGEILWRLEEGGYSALKVDGDYIYYPTTLGQVLCLDKNKGQKIWSYKLKEGLATQIQLYKGLVAFGESQGDLVFLNNQNGAKIASFEPGRGVMATPTFDEEKSKVYFISGEANLYSLEAKWKTKNEIEYLR